MQAQDKPETETFYDVYLHIGDKRHFCKRRKRKADALRLSNALDLKYKYLGYLAQIKPVEVPAD